MLEVVGFVVEVVGFVVEAVVLCIVDFVVDLVVEAVVLGVIDFVVDFVVDAVVRVVVGTPLVVTAWCARRIFLMPALTVTVTVETGYLALQNDCAGA